MWCGFHLVSQARCFFLFGGLATPPNRKSVWPARLAFTDKMLEENWCGEELEGSGWENGWCSASLVPRPSRGRGRAW